MEAQMHDRLLTGTRKHFPKILIIVSLGLCLYYAGFGTERRLVSNDSISVNNITARNYPLGGYPYTPSAHSIPHIPDCASSDVIEDGSFEGGGIPSTTWNDPQIPYFGSPVCNIQYCGTGGGTSLPRSGDYWAWFGGFIGGETSA